MSIIPCLLCLRLVEFEETGSGSLTIEQFNTIDLEEEADPPCFTQSRREAKLKQVQHLYHSPSTLIINNHVSLIIVDLIIIRWDNE